MHSGEITALLLAWREGDHEALNRLMPLVYTELRRRAHAYMRRERANHTLETTGLVHESYAKLVRAPHVDWRDRNHFFAICAQQMRRVLVDHARAHGYLKRGGGVTLIPLADAQDVGHETPLELFALDEALTRLADFDPRKCQIVEMHYFGGLTFKEIAELLDISVDSVIWDWKMARAWLLRELKHERDCGT